MYMCGRGTGGQLLQPLVLLLRTAAPPARVRILGQRVRHAGREAAAHGRHAQAMHRYVCIVCMYVSRMLVVAVVGHVVGGLDSASF